MIKRVLLKDIAEKLNLTINTVSRALNDKDDISEKTKEAVRNTADELGYIPNYIASSMRTKSTRTIAIVFDNLKNPYFTLMADLINQYLINHGYLMMIFTEKGSSLTNNLFRKILSRKVDGVISFLKPNLDVANLVHTLHIPMIVLGREADDLKIDSIFTNDYLGGSLIGEYFYQKGYQKVGYLGGPDNILCNTIRAKGFFEYYNNKNLDALITYANQDESQILDNLETLIKNDKEAIFCFNDAIAYTTILYLEKHYPNNKIEVAGYDNIASLLNLPIKLTTIGTNVETMINEGVNQLLTKINNYDLPLYKKSLDTFLVTK